MYLGGFGLKPIKQFPSVGFSNKRFNKISEKKEGIFKIGLKSPYDAN